MQPPRFWYGAEGRESAPVLQMLAQPLSWIYGAVTATKIRNTTPEYVAATVICVGNLPVGGTGKTPVVRAIRAALATDGIAAATLSRGHGGRLAGPLKVDAAQHTAADVGDEPLLHARDGAAWIARDRLAGARAMVGHGVKAIVMDDGFQNPALAKDISLLVFDASAGAGNGRVVPAGPLREPLAAGFARADAVILMQSGAEAPHDEDTPLARALSTFRGPVLHATLAPAGEAPSGPLVAFAGIGRPQKFYDTLTGLGATLADAISFADHHPYTEADLRRLRAHASAHGARLITTEKDFVRLPAAARADIATLPVTARFADPAALVALLKHAVAKAAERA
ncbi:MAG: tetraacyldisaccharide 4'-kinase [Alphaproteobacteria bacterium]|mgnify:CR=1 FL=1|nr:tetraacyldisaccharide 4'-kinase [Alphaproteobacteria bacterium]